MSATDFLWDTGTSNNGMSGGSSLTLMTTELNSLVNNAFATSSVGGASGVFTCANTNAAMLGEIFLNVGNPGMAGAPNAGGCFAGWFLLSYDGGTTFETAADVVRSQDFYIPLYSGGTPGSGTVFKADGPVQLPSLKFKVYLANVSGVALGNGSTTAPSLILCPMAPAH